MKSFTPNKVQFQPTNESHSHIQTKTARVMASEFPKYELSIVNLCDLKKSHTASLDSETGIPSTSHIGHESTGPDQPASRKISYSKTTKPIKQITKFVLRIRDPNSDHNNCRVKIDTDQLQLKF